MVFICVDTNRLLLSMELIDVAYHLYVIYYHTLKLQLVQKRKLNRAKTAPPLAVPVLKFAPDVFTVYFLQGRGNGEKQGRHNHGVRKRNL